ncbi:hypothetical protein LPJGGPFB_01507 [Ensifer adhaerens]|nr:hypothetical protein [Ensifer adhaerens]
MVAWPKIIAGGPGLAGVLWLVFAIREDGVRSVTNAFERQNNTAAHSTGVSLPEYDGCPNGLRDFGAGNCRRPFNER